MHSIVRSRRRRALAVLPALITILGLLGLPATASAATVSGSYAIQGTEYSATSTEGRFAGTASGSSGDSATWNAVIDHTELTRTATITGGSASLATSNLVLIGADITAGSVKLVRQQHGCGKQTYAVSASLADVTRSDSSAVGSGSVSATLTHYRTRVLGQCIVYFATVAGTISLSF